MAYHLLVLSGNLNTKTYSLLLSVLLALLWTPRGWLLHSHTQCKSLQISTEVTL